MRVHLVVIPAIVFATSALVGCIDSDGSPEAGSARPPAIEVAGDPAALSGAGESGADGASDIDTVVMIGDSITLGAMPHLEERFDQLSIEHQIEAVNGKRMALAVPENPSGAEVAAFLAANGDGDHSDEVWVVALGTNDIGKYESPDQIAGAVNEVLAQVPEEAALVWVDTFLAGSPEQTEAINSIIRQRVEQRGDSVVAPWTAFVADPGVLTGDGVHPTEGGADVFAFVVAETVRAFLGR